MKVHVAASDGSTLEADQPGLERPTADGLCLVYADRVYQFATMIARDDVEADDLAQTALEQAIRALPNYRPERGTFDGWLWRIVVNAARDAGRAATRRRLLVQRLIALRGGQPPADDIPTGITDGQLIEAVRRLTPLQRSVTALRFGADLDYRHVGLALGISPVAARVATHRALAALRSALRQAEGQG